MTGKCFPKRGEIYRVNLNSTIGCETQKLRPCLIVSNDIGNEASSLVMAAPITSKIKHVYPFEVKTLVDGRPAKVMLNQCRAVDKIRLQDKMDVLDSAVMHEVDEAIKIVFSLR